LIDLKKGPGILDITLLAQSSTHSDLGIKNRCDWLIDIVQGSGILCTWLQRWVAKLDKYGTGQLR
jgi:hypothetical protein